MSFHEPFWFLPLMVVSSGSESLMCPSFFFFSFYRAVDVDKAKILRARDWLWASFDPRPLKWSCYGNSSCCCQRWCVRQVSPPPQICTFHLVSTEALLLPGGGGERGEQFNTSAVTTVGLMKWAYSPGPNAATIFGVQPLPFFCRAKFH